MAEPLTLDTLMDALCDYRQTLGGETPIAIGLDGEGGLAMVAGVCHAGYLLPADDETFVGAGPDRAVVPLHLVAGLGDDARHAAGARVALVLTAGPLGRSAPRALAACVPAPPPVIGAAWPDALEVVHE